DGAGVPVERPRQELAEARAPDIQRMAESTQCVAHAARRRRLLVQNQENRKPRLRLEGPCRSRSSVRKGQHVLAAKIFWPVGHQFRKAGAQRRTIARQILISRELSHRRSKSRARVWQRTRLITLPRLLTPTDLPRRAGRGSYGLRVWKRPTAARMN